MADGRLPGEGPLRFGSVALPAGRLITAECGSGQPVAWATVDPVPEPGRVWDALSAALDQTGLVPILLDGLSGGTSRPWDAGEFEDPEDPRRADGLDPAAFLKAGWNGHVSDDDNDLAEQVGPFGRAFPGLAPPELTPLAPARRRQALDLVLPELRATKQPHAPARIGLVAAGRPADVPAALGWLGLTNLPLDHALLNLCAVLRSWEDRFGAVLVDVGFADLRLLVERPPRSLQAAERIAAEHFALAGDGIPYLADSLIEAPIWTLWWD
jgi:Domain of unknown function (DUF4253)